MRAMRAEQFSGYEALKLVELPKPTVTDGKVLVRITAAGVTPLDHTILSGKFHIPEVPLVLGNEGAGVVAEGGGADFPAGSRVMFWGAYGAFEDGTYREWIAVRKFWRKVPRRSQLCPLVAVSGRSRRLLQGRSRSLEAVPVDAQLSYFRFKCLSWNSQLNGGAGWTPNHAFGFPEGGFEHFSFVLGKVSNERNRRHS